MLYVVDLVDDQRKSEGQDRGLEGILAAPREGSQGPDLGGPIIKHLKTNFASGKKSFYIKPFLMGLHSAVLLFQYKWILFIHYSVYIDIILSVFL